MGALLTGCDQPPFNHAERAMDQAKQKQAAGDYAAAANAYERALDGTAKSAEAHFRLALLYDGKLNDPISAVHHLRRYLALAPTGLHVSEANANLSRLQLNLATSLEGGTLISHADALRLKTENAELRKELALRPVTLAAAPVAGPKSGVESGRAAERDAEKKQPPGARTYKVQPGDTLASIALKFYRNKARTKDIQDANLNAVPNPKKLKTGQVLIIP